MGASIGHGSYVVHESHPEHGLGRVIASGEFAMRVLFSNGGIRVFRADDTGRLRNVPSPAAADVAALDERERAHAAGRVEFPSATPKPPAPKRARKAK